MGDGRGERTGDDPNGQGFRKSRLGVELHFEDGEAGVDAVELAGVIGRQSVLLRRVLVEEFLELADSPEGGLAGAEALRLVVGQHFRGARGCAALLLGGFVGGSGGIDCGGRKRRDWV